MYFVTEPLKQSMVKTKEMLDLYMNKDEDKYEKRTVKT